jgi:diacylglycerol kinase (ATP)
MRRVLLIRNPSSGGSDDETYREIEDALARLGSVSVVEPSGPEAFDSEVQGAARGTNIVVVAGGDGTFNCAVNALSERFDDLTFGLIPMGTGNDLARTLGISLDPQVAAAALDGASAGSIDVSRAAGAGVERLFVNACMGGFPVEVDEAVGGLTKRLLGPLAFVAGGIKAAPGLTRSVVRINGVEVPEVVAAGVGNGRTCGGGVPVWPSALPGDGLLDGCVLPAANPAAAAVLLGKVKTGAHEDLDAVVTRREAKITFEADPAIEFNVDGEVLGLKSPATFEIVQKLAILVPDDRYLSSHS